MATTQRVVVDPITRIEGHLRIEAETDVDGRILKAYSAGTMVRGIEIILRGRDPRDAWAFAQRICGVCTLVHGVASVRSVEDALHRAIPGYALPPNAELIRNLMIAAQHVHDHVMHFYHLHALDWVDVVSALKADPRAASTLAQSISDYSRSSPGYFADVQRKVKTFVEQGQLGIFANGYWGHPAYKLPPEANLMALAHYLDALAWQREVVKLPEEWDEVGRDVDQAEDVGQRAQQNQPRRHPDSPVEKEAGEETPPARDREPELADVLRLVRAHGLVQ